MIKSQQGFSLIESLISFSILAITMLAIAQLNASTITSNAQSSARFSALDLATQKIEQLRNMTTTAEYDAFDDSISDEVITYNHESFSLSWTVNKFTESPRYAQVNVTVVWYDSNSVKRSVTLTSNIPEPSPKDFGKWYDRIIIGQEQP